MTVCTRRPGTCCSGNRTSRTCESALRRFWLQCRSTQYSRAASPPSTDSDCSSESTAACEQWRIPEGSRISSNVVRYPDEKLAIALLCNSEEINPITLTHEMTDLCLGDVPGATSGSDGPAAAKVTLKKSELAARAGSYYVALPYAASPKGHVVPNLSACAVDRNNAGRLGVSLATLRSQVQHL